jgi:PAS domain S-box-containing protein
LRDVVGLSALPAVWTGYNARQIAKEVAGVLFRTLNLDLVYLRLPRLQSLEVLQVRNAEDENLIGQLSQYTATDSLVPVTVVSARGNQLRLSWHRLTSRHPDHCFAAGSARSDFPTDSERLLLRVALNQAETWLERKKAEEALAEESDFRRGIENSVLAGVAAVDLQGRQTYVNRAFADMVGWDVVDLIGASEPFVYWPLEEHTRIRTALGRVMETDTPTLRAELIFRRRNEERFDVLALAAPLHDPIGKPVGYVLSSYDITERKWAERSAAFLAEAGEILNGSLEERATLKAIGNLVVPHFADWCFVDLMTAEGASERIAAAHADPAQGPLAERFIRIYAAIDPPLGVSKTFVDGRSILMADVSDSDLQRLARDPDHLEALRALEMHSFFAVPMNSRGRTLGVITFIATSPQRSFRGRDIALAEELARRAALAMDNARLYMQTQEANRAKDEFLAKLSHELRTPMTAILGWVHMLQLGALSSEDTDRALSDIAQSTRAQARLVEDILDISRIVTGKLTVEIEPVRLADIVNSAAAVVRPPAEAKRQTIEIDLLVPDIIVAGDSARLQQVFWNLLSNAVKFTPPDGAIRVAVDQPDSETATVIVSDTGPGISAQLLPVIFERFHQGERGARLGGLGLGLAIAKDVVELHGGSIRAHSQGPNQGATFTVTLPVVLSGAAAPH